MRICNFLDLNSLKLNLPEYDESSWLRARFPYLGNTTQYERNRLSTDAVITPRVIVRRVLFSGDQRIGAEQLLVIARFNLVDHAWLQINDHRSRCQLSYLKKCE